MKNEYVVDGSSHLSWPQMLLKAKRRAASRKSQKAMQAAYFLGGLLI
jgi:hypothetical protein